MPPLDYVTSKASARRVQDSMNTAVGICYWLPQDVRWRNLLVRSFSSFLFSLSSFPYIFILTTSRKRVINSSANFSKPRDSPSNNSKPWISLRSAIESHSLKECLLQGFSSIRGMEDGWRRPWVRTVAGSLYMG
jgi:hypothetical protein